MKSECHPRFLWAILMKKIILILGVVYAAQSLAVQPIQQKPTTEEAASIEKDERQQNHVFGMMAAGALPLEFEACAVLYPELKPRVDKMWGDYPVTALVARQDLSQCIDRSVVWTKQQCQQVVGIGSKDPAREALYERLPELGEQAFRLFKKNVVEGIPVIMPCIEQDEKEQVEYEKKRDDALMPLIQGIVDQSDAAYPNGEDLTRVLNATSDAIIAISHFKNPQAQYEYTIPQNVLDAKGQTWKQFWRVYSPWQDIKNNWMKSRTRVLVSCEHKAVAETFSFYLTRKNKSKGAWVVQKGSNEIQLSDGFAPGFEQGDYQFACGKPACNASTPNHAYQNQWCSLEDKNILD